MARSLVVLLTCAVIYVLCAGCDDGSSGTMVPHAPVGLLISSEEGVEQAGLQRDLTAVGYQFVMVWADGDVAAELYNVYRKTGDGAYEKLNSELVRRGPFLDIPPAPVGLGFVDITFDIESTSPYSYYVVAANSYGEETAPSEAITLVPADIDPATQLTGLTPNQPSGVGVNPTFSWDPVSGAASYCVVLMEITQDYGEVPIWIYRTSETSASLESTGGVTYLDGIGPSLGQDTDYSWGVFAVNSNNVAIAATFVEFSTEIQ